MKNLNKIANDVLLFFSTIDVDMNRVDKRVHIASVVMTCPSIVRMTVERSSSRRGWHYSLFCTKDCDACSKKYDDPIRYEADHVGREPHQRNVLFDRKTQFYPKAGIKRSFQKGKLPKTERL